MESDIVILFFILFPMILLPGCVCCTTPPDVSDCFCTEFLPGTLHVTITDDNGNCPCWELEFDIEYEVGGCSPGLSCWFACFDLDCVVGGDGAFLRLECASDCSSMQLTTGQQDTDGGESCDTLGTCGNVYATPDGGCSCSPLELVFSDLQLNGVDCCGDATDVLNKRITVTITE